ncbi:hypothetical protein [Luteococcus japonicus]|uniref:Uncharacterized protein n=1 Tax=Luteococcus japonicus LSP_Lj1 TaxID=1255658 RepID=A0A1R4JY13_9ACTN|nr:hypothetical protein [Luteococcus japonicus]SJN36725.1 hypothetical protein FM114_10125 [Luteococcus japonicus LSP_Lj1]
MSNSRYSQVSRRAFLGGVSLAALTGLAACANDSTAATPTALASAGNTTSGSLPSTATATVSFTYASSGGGMVKNPY